MSKGKYKIVKVSDDLFELFHGTLSLTTFPRNTFRESLEACCEEWGFSSNWIGSMLRLFNKQYPLLSQMSKRTDFDRWLYKVGEQGIVDYLRQKGLKVSMNYAVSDIDLVRYLESRGYVIEGLIDDIYYFTESKRQVDYASA